MAARKSPIPLDASTSHDAYVTGSRGGDLVLLFAFLSFCLAVAPWLRVYHRITAFELTLTRLEDDGSRTPLALPPELDFHNYWNRTPQDLLPRIEQSFRKLSAKRPAARYELTVDYSFNSPALDQQVVWRAP
jgi:hypothetical protein